MEKNMGKQKMVNKTIQPLQLTNLTPAAVTGGRAANTLGVIIIGNYKGAAAFFDLDKLANQPLVLAEKAHCLDKVDGRNGVAVTVENGADVGDVIPGEIEVPEGEVWYLNRLSVTCPAADATGSAGFNILVSAWPKTATGGDKPYFATNQAAMGATTDIDLPAQGELGEELRLVGGDKLTLQLTVTVAFTADKVFRLDPYGRKGKALVA
jgi:hypothetical protein